jgi:hypothetical protein
VLIGAGVIVALVVVGLIVARLGSHEEAADGGSASSGAGGNRAGAAYFDDFADPSTGWETTTGGVTQEYRDGTYQIRMNEDASPGVFALATGGTRSAGLSILDQRVGVEVRILGESDSRRDGFGVSCRVSPGGDAYVFIVSTSGGWSIQKLTAGRNNPRTLVDSNEVPTAVPIRDVNEIVAECTGGGSEPAMLQLTVNGTTVPPVEDDDHPLGAGAAGMAVAGPTLFEPAGLAISFDDFRVDDLSVLDQPSG